MVRIKDAQIAPIEIMTDNVRDTVILGSGCAGNTAAIYAARANLKPLVVSRPRAGRDSSPSLRLVENFPGFPDGINGPDLVENMKKQAEQFRRRIPARLRRRSRPVAAPVPSEHRWASGSRPAPLIIASGASARWLGLPSEQKLIGHGVSSCATCDGFFYRDKKIMVIGGGDSAMEEANFLYPLRAEGRWCTGATPFARRRSCSSGPAPTRRSR